jgi:hypothetical protein
MVLVYHSPVSGKRCAMSNEDGIKEVIELLHELKLELVAEMDYASLELQVEAIIDKMYLLSEDEE